MKKVIPIRVLLSLSVSLFFPGCASIVSKSSYPVSIKTTPSGAAVSITDKKSKEIFKGTSPATLKLKSGSGYFSRAEYQVKLSMPGYSEKVVPIQFRINGWYFGNLFLGGFLGMLIVDPATGAMWRLETAPINETLKSLSSEVSSLKILSINDVPDNMKSRLVQVK